MLPALELHNVRRCFGAMLAVDDVSLTLAPGEFLTLLGPSGSGKTSTLRLVGGFDRPDQGQIHIKGMRVDRLPPNRRDTTTIFQTGALFPHKTVAENIAYGLRMRGVPKSEIPGRIAQALDLVRLKRHKDRYPAQLSGGEKQRVALARSLAVRAAVLLFDEPLSALDLTLRLQLRADIRQFHEELGFSAIYVTHDQGEAMAMSDRIAIMRAGRIEQIDTPQQIYTAPVNEFVFGFIGESSSLTVVNNAGQYYDATGAPIDLWLQRDLPEGVSRLYFRPTALRLAPGVGDGPCRLRARVHFIEYLGGGYRYHLRAGSNELIADLPVSASFQKGDEVGVSWSCGDMKFFQ